MRSKKSVAVGDMRIYARLITVIFYYFSVEERGN